MRSQRELNIGGYLTVYLAIVMTVMLSLYLTLIEGARCNAIRLEAECVTDIALNSVLAEYHRELYRQYNLFAIDTSYGTPQAGSKNLEKHLKSYLDGNLSMDNIFLSDFLYKDFMAMSVKTNDVTRVSIMTDDKGAVFRKRAVEAIKDDVGITLMEQLTGWTKIIENNGLMQRDVAAEKDAIDREIASYDGISQQISEEEWITVEVDNPTDGLELLRKKGILETVVSNPEELSLKGIVADTLIEHRMKGEQISQGNYMQDELSAIEKMEERFFFQEYLLRYMGRYGCEDENNALHYQMEYILFGKNGDIENLRKTANALCAIREAANAIYIYSDETKCAEAEVVAAVLAAVCGVPELEPLFKHTLLLGWAYVESLYDVKILLAGGRIPLLKDSSSWHYDLDTALQMNLRPEEESSGISYEDYLRIFMSFTDIDLLTARAMNMVEADIRLTPGNQYFRLDACYDCIETKISIESAYGYEYEITRQKKY